MFETWVKYSVKLGYVTDLHNIISNYKTCKCCHGTLGNYGFAHGVRQIITNGSYRENAKKKLVLGKEIAKRDNKKMLTNKQSPANGNGSILQNLKQKLNSSRVFILAEGRQGSGSMLKINARGR